MSTTDLSARVIVLLAALNLAACFQDSTPTVNIATGANGGNYQMAGLAIASAVNKAQLQNGIRVEENTSAGSVDNINAVLAGRTHFGLAQADHQYQAVNGLSEWRESGAQQDLRAVFSLYPEAVTIIAGADSGITRMADLRGKRVDIGIEGSGTRSNALEALNVAGLDPQQDLEVRQEILESRLAMWMHNELDAFFYTVGHPNTLINLATYSVRGVRFIPLANIETLLERNPYYSRTVISADLYARNANATDVETVAVKATMVTSATVPNAVVYTLTKAVFENLSTIAERRPFLNRMTREAMLEGLTAPLHPGAAQYFAEIGLELPDARAVAEVARQTNGGRQSPIE